MMTPRTQYRFTSALPSPHGVDFHLSASCFMVPVLGPRFPQDGCCSPRHPVCPSLCSKEGRWEGKQSLPPPVTSLYQGERSLRRPCTPHWLEAGQSYAQPGPFIGKVGKDCCDWLTLICVSRGWAHWYLNKIRVQLPRREEKWLLGRQPVVSASQLARESLGGGKLEVVAAGPVWDARGSRLSP